MANNDATVPFGEWRPDIALLDSEFASIADNVLSTANSYKPLASLLAFTALTLPTLPCVGLTAARKLDGSWLIFAGSLTKLYKFAAGGWVDVTRVAGGNYNVFGLWSFAQFGSFLYACNINDVLQQFDLEAGTNFIASPGTPPQASTVKNIGDFLVLAGLASNPRKIRWCSINNPTAWVVGINLCDEQEFPEGGSVQGVSGSEIGYVLQDRSIRVAQFLPGDTNFIFQFSRVLKDRGCVGPYAHATVSDVLYFLSEDGPFALQGAQLMPIGVDKVNEWFLANSDIARRQLVQCITSTRPYVFFIFHSTAAAMNYDRALIYNWVTQRWTTGSIIAQVYAQLASANLDLDTDGAEANDSNLDSTAQSLDSFLYIGGRPSVCAIDASGVLGSLAGPPLRAQIETGDVHPIPGQRAYVNEVYPLVDSNNILIAAAPRERLGDTVTYGTDNPLEVTGSASVIASGRVHRFRATIPAGSAWTNAQGLRVAAQPDGDG